MRRGLKQRRLVGRNVIGLRGLFWAGPALLAVLFLWLCLKVHTIIRTGQPRAYPITTLRQRSSACADSIEEVSKTPEAPFTRVLVQTWKSHVIPEYFQPWADDWRRMHRSWTYNLVTDQDNEQLIKIHFPFLLETYRKLPLSICRVDMMRYAWLYVHGGVYADLDVIPLRTMDELWGKHATAGVLLGQMGDDIQFQHSLPNALMAARHPRHLFWLFALWEIHINSFHRMRHKSLVQPEEVAGPAALHRAWRSWNRWDGNLYHLPFRSWIELEDSRLGFHGVDSPNRLPLVININDCWSISDIHILEPPVWYGLDWSNVTHQTNFRKPILRAMAKGKPVDLSRFDTPEAYAVTVWTHSWGKEKSVFKLQKKIKRRYKRQKQAIIEQSKQLEHQ